MDIRCPGKKHLVTVTECVGVVERKCDSRVCGAGRGQVVLHQWDLSTGELTRTTRFRNPQLNTHPQLHNGSLIPLKEVP